VLFVGAVCQGRPCELTNQLARIQTNIMKKHTGFTLIELMIVVAIIGIIAAIAYPSYQRYIQETRRGQAQADLLELAQFMERRYSNGFDYRDGGGNPDLPFTQSPREGNPVAYLISFSEDVERAAFTLQAVPQGIQAEDDCGTLTIDETGAKGAEEAGCWQG